MRLAYAIILTCMDSMGHFPTTKISTRLTKEHIKLSMFIGQRLKPRKKELYAFFLLKIEFNQIWEKRKEIIYQTVQLAKKDVLDLVERTFAELEHKYTQTVHEEEIKLGMKNGDKVMKMLEAHSSESEKLFNIQKDLAGGVKGPEIAKLLFTVFLPKNKELTNKIGEDFANLAAYDINL